MNEYLATGFALFGGLALFLFGMSAMSDSLQKAAGDKMKQVLGFLTRNPVMGVLAGTLVTALLQSSSATTVMVVGFVSAGLMSLRQGISVALGASIGTTITAQIVAFKLTDYIMPIIFIGFFIYFVFKKENIKNIGMGIMAFGILFLGIEYMGDAMGPLASSPVFLEMIDAVKNIPVLGLLVGTGMTLVVQSSSATVAVLQSFAATPGPDGNTTLTLAQSLPILFGDNIGTTITALIACIGQSKDAKRVAIAHTLFKTIGSVVFMFLIPFYAPLIMAITPGDPLVVLPRQIANAHTIFNVTNTIFWLPFIGVLVSIVMAIIPGKDETAEKGDILPIFLNNAVLNQPVAAMHLLSMELERCGKMVGEMAKQMRVALVGPNRRESIFEVQEAGREVGGIQRHVSAYIAALLAGTSVTEKQSEHIASLLSINNDVSRIAERLVEVAEIAASHPDGKVTFSEEGKAEVESIFRVMTQAYDNVITALVEKDKGLAETVVFDMTKYHKIIKRSGKNHLKRWKKKECAEELVDVYPEILTALQRIGDNCLSLAEEVLEDTELMFLSTPDPQLANDNGDKNASEESLLSAIPFIGSKKDASKSEDSANAEAENAEEAIADEAANDTADSSENDNSEEAAVEEVAEAADSAADADAEKAEPKKNGKNGDKEASAKDKAEGKKKDK
ncbi:MAG: Na/Pi cotransporter family protein [Phoenicibacter congonensis]|uniref:Na/Pi cotransporter family protein n=1 Tax=Phoenicibacter congonensis TaxID=1944646 RepID=A0AA43RGE0_9ACTN|nr:Na/Pi cotransporter family protein [Phoenicibacter congonensis]